MVYFNCFYGIHFNLSSAKIKKITKLSPSHIKSITEFESGVFSKRANIVENELHMKIDDTKMSAI